MSDANNKPENLATYKYHISQIKDPKTSFTPEIFFLELVA